MIKWCVLWGIAAQFVACASVWISLLFSFALMEIVHNDKVLQIKP